MPKTSWDLEKIKREASKYKTRSDFKSENIKAYTAAQKRGILDIVCSDMQQVVQKWDLNKLQIEALKYSNRRDFRKNNRKAYNTAEKKELLDLICGHMDFIRKPCFKDEELKDIALKYNNIRDFRKNNNGAYQVILNIKMYSFLYHMTRSYTSSILEKKVFDKIKESFPDAKKFKDNGVFIKDKPYIKGFEIDILIPSLNKGIEVDGDYWHSFKAMKSRKKNWAEVDIINYHEIKDSYFLNKGVSILHIKEFELKKDFEGCVDKIKKYLLNVV